jgi:hemerythrin-like domain-containing protein
LFGKIRSEHQKILNALERWSSLATDEEKHLTASWLWQFAELKHHEQEEKLLFQKVYDRPKINEGGPLCTLYFDFHMADNPLERAKKLTQQVATLEDYQKKFYDCKSPVCVPLDEHRGGKEVLRYLLTRWQTLSDDEKKDCMKIYKEIQSQHILKEESCFFHLCVRLLSDEELNELATAWIAA